jgi:hypothetical protein
VHLLLDQWKDHFHSNENEHITGQAYFSKQYLYAYNNHTSARILITIDDKEFLHIDRLSYEFYNLKRGKTGEEK